MTDDPSIGKVQNWQVTHLGESGDVKCIHCRLFELSDSCCYAWVAGTWKIEEPERRLDYCPYFEDMREDKPQEKEQ